MRYLIRRDGQLLGPFTAAEIHELLADGALNLHDQAVLEGEITFQELHLFFPSQSTPASLGSTAGPATGEPETVAPLIPAGAIFEISAPEIPAATPNYRPSPIAEVLAVTANYRPKSVSDLINDSVDMTREKGRSWLLVLLVPIIISIILFIPVISASFDIMKDQIADQMVQVPDFYSQSEPVPSKPVNPPAPKLPLIMFFLIGLNIYAGISAVAFVLRAAKEYHEGSDYHLGELIAMVQPGVLYLCLAMLLFGIAVFLITLPLILSPLRFKPGLSIFTGLILLVFNLRLFPLPFLIVLEKTRWRDLIPLSWKLTRNQLPRLLRLFLVFLLVQLFVAMAVLINPFAGIMVLSLNIFTLILATLFFLDLQERAALTG